MHRTFCSPCSILAAYSASKINQFLLAYMGSYMFKNFSHSDAYITYKPFNKVLLQLVM